MACLDGGRTWWAHIEFTHINATPTILRKKIEDLRQLGAFMVRTGGAGKPYGVDQDLCVESRTNQKDGGLRVLSRSFHRSASASISLLSADGCYVDMKQDSA